jgi:hypothetical protein
MENISFKSGAERPIPADPGGRAGAVRVLFAAKIIQFRRLVIQLLGNSPKKKPSGL